MATDPITGLSLDDQSAQQALDYLGRPAPLGLAQQTALPGAQGASPSAGPASMGGTGAAAPSAAPAAGGQSVGAGFGQNTFGPDVPGLGTQLGVKAAGLIAGQAKSQIPKFFGGSPPYIDPSLLAPDVISGVSGGSTYIGSGSQVPFQVNPADIGAGAGGGSPASGAAGLGADVGASSLGLLSKNLLGPLGMWSGAYDLGKLALNLAGMKGGETTGNMWGDMAMGLLGPFGDVGKGLVSRLTGPSSAWQNFGQHLGQTLQGESSAINTLVPWLGKAQTRGDIDQSLDLFRQLVETGAGVGGYQLGGRTAGGAPQVGLLPGAFGSKHEGGLTADFGPVTSALNDYISKLYDVLPEGAASSPLSYEAYAAGMGNDQFGQMQGMVQQLMGVPQDQWPAALSGVDPAMQQKIMDVAYMQASQGSITPGGPDPYAESLRLAGMQ